MKRVLYSIFFLNKLEEYFKFKNQKIYNILLFISCVLGWSIYKYLRSLKYSLRVSFLKEVKEELKIYKVRSL